MSSCGTGGCGCASNAPNTNSRPLITKNKVNKDLQDYWDTIYNVIDYTKSGWYEDVPSITLQLIEECKVEKNAHILIVGAGTTTLVDHLLKQGYSNISVVDISATALELLEERIGKDNANVNLIIDDLTSPSILEDIPSVDLWVDRAVFHFFTETEDQATYVDLMKKLIRPKGKAIIATFSLKGASRCSGLPVRRYNKLMLQEKLRDGFELIKSLETVYITPSGDERPYVYALFERKE